MLDPDDKSKFLNDLYKKNDNTSEVQKKIRERINELLIPIKIILFYRDKEKNRALPLLNSLFLKME